jgi:hypothetical protein
MVFSTKSGLAAMSANENFSLARSLSPAINRVIADLSELDMPPGVGVSGLESDGGDQFVQRNLILLMAMNCCLAL